MRIGLVDLDTSHPEAWIPIERDLGHEIVGLWDGGDVHPPDYARRFASDNDIPCVYDRLEQMVDDVDCAIIHSCDWDTHVPKARSFVQAGKAVLIDKPVAGDMRDLGQLRAWAEQGARITGGSSLRFCAESRRFLDHPVEQRGTPDFVLCGCAVDEFNYGIHAYAMLASILGSDAESVRHLGQGVQQRVQVNWRDGKCGILVIGSADAWLPYYVTVTTNRAVHQFLVDHMQVYRSLLDSVLPYLAGETEQPPLAIDELIAPEHWALAARCSRERGGEIISLDDPSLSAVRYDGEQFALSYRCQRYPDGAA